MSGWFEEAARLLAYGLAETREVMLGGVDPRDYRAGSWGDNAQTDVVMLS